MLFRSVFTLFAIAVALKAHHIRHKVLIGNVGGAEIGGGVAIAVGIFLVNDIVVRGALSLEDFSKAVDMALEKKAGK